MCKVRRGRGKEGERESRFWRPGVTKRSWSGSALEKKKKSPEGATSQALPGRADFGARGPHSVRLALQVDSVGFACASQVGLSFLICTLRN